MVQPRKVHGVRVLPSPTTSRLVTGHGPHHAAAKPSRLSRSPAIRAPRPPPDELGPQPPTRWAGRRLTNPDDRSCDQRRHRYARCARRPANHSTVVEDSETNWQCRVSSGSGDGWSAVGQVGQLAAVAEGVQAGVDGSFPDDGDSAAHETLLMTKKKDAEIAALLRHIRLTGMSREANHVRRRPAFNECVIERINFERSLGYFP